jgi:hypothetical protein
MTTTVSAWPQPWVQMWSSSRMSQIGLVLWRIFMATAADLAAAALDRFLDARDGGSTIEVTTKFAAFDHLGDPDVPATTPSTSTPTPPKGLKTPATTSPVRTAMTQSGIMSTFLTVVSLGRFTPDFLHAYRQLVVCQLRDMNMIGRHGPKHLAQQGKHDMFLVMVRLTVLALVFAIPAFSQTDNDTVRTSARPCFPGRGRRYRKVRSAIREIVRHRRS